MDRRPGDRRCRTLVTGPPGRGVARRHRSATLSPRGAAPWRSGNQMFMRPFSPFQPLFFC